MLIARIKHSHTHPALQNQRLLMLWISTGRFLDIWFSIGRNYPFAFMVIDV